VKTFYSEAVLAELRAELAAATDPDERRRLENVLAEAEGYSLTGDAHGRVEGGDGST
jgi:hypothetical protein